MSSASLVPRRVATGGFVIAVVLCFAAGTNAAQDRPKTHMLYMGSDVEVEHLGAVRRVEDVEGSSFVVVVDGQRTIVPARKGLLNIKIDETLKVSRAFATITDLKGERAYTPANDPRRKFHEAAGGAGAAGAGLNVAAALAASSAHSAAAAAANDSVPINNLLEAQNAANTSQQQFDSMIQSLGSDMNSPGYHAGQMQEELAAESYDAFEVAFEISSEHVFENPYVVVVVRYREQAQRPDTARNWIYAETLPPLTEKPRRIRMQRGGFPKGFHVESFRVHLYDSGVEAATSVSRKRVRLSDEDAFQFEVIEYVARHRGVTLRPLPVKSRVPTDVHLRLPGEKIDRTVYVRVGKDGKPIGAFLDEKCSQKVGDADFETVLLELRFNPALNNGKPVEGVAQVNLGRLTI